MTLKISSVFTYDEDAGNYIQAVESADGQALEPATRKAINNFVLGCKADGIWSAIKASCILSGARTLAGALVPLAGTSPTNYNFVSGDYNRKTGLVGDASTKYLDSNRFANSDPQNNYSSCVFAYSAGSPSNSTQLYLSAGFNTGGNSIGISSSQAFSRCRSSTFTFTGSSTATGILGISRAASASYLFRSRNTTTSILVASQQPPATTTLLFRESHAGSTFFSNARIAFYSIGEFLDLALLDARVTDLINAFGVTIP